MHPIREAGGLRHQAWRCAAPAVLAAAWLLPADGFGVDLCLWHRLTQWPCGACGMTRAFQALARGDLLRAIAWHPLSLIAYPATWAWVGAALLPTVNVRRLAHRLTRHRAWWYGGLCAFLGFGFGRLGFFVLKGLHFP